MIGKDNEEETISFSMYLSSSSRAVFKGSNQCSHFFSTLDTPSDDGGGTNNSPYVHGEYSSRCDSKYKWKMFDMEVLFLKSKGQWNNNDGYDPKSELEKLLQNKHPNAMIYNKEIEQMISGKYPLRPLIVEKQQTFAPIPEPIDPSMATWTITVGT